MLVGDGRIRSVARTPCGGLGRDEGVIDELIRAVRKRPRDDVEDLVELEIRRVIRFHNFDDARVLAVDHDAVDRTESEDLGREEREILAFLGEVATFGMEELEVAVDADGDGIRTHDFTGDSELTHNREYGLMWKNDTSPFNQSLTHLSNICDMLGFVSVSTPKPQPLIHYDLSYRDFGSPHPRVHHIL